MSKGIRSAKNPAQNNYRDIRSFILGEINELTDTQNKILDRFTDLYTLIKRHGQNNAVVIRAYKALKKNASDLPHDIHIARDMKHAMELFGDVERVNKEILQKMIIDDCWEDVQNLKALLALSTQKRIDDKEDDEPISSSDLKVLAKLMSLKDKRTKTLIEAGGLNQRDLNTPNFEKLEPHTFNIQIDPVSRHILSKIMESSQGGLLDFREVFDESIIEEAEILEENDREIK